MNLMILINPWLDINCQVITKYATVPKSKLWIRCRSPLRQVVLNNRENQECLSRKPFENRSWSLKLWNSLETRLDPQRLKTNKSKYYNRRRAGEMHTMWKREEMREKVAGEWRDAGIQPAHGLFGPTNAASSAGHWLMSLSRNKWSYSHRIKM